MRRPFRLAAALTGVALLAGAPAYAAVPYPGPGTGHDAYDYAGYLHLQPGAYPPNDITPDSGVYWRYSSKDACTLYGPTDSRCSPVISADPQELHGVTGASVDKAWLTTTGRPDVIIANVDSGIMWDRKGDMEDLNNKVWLNAGELPVPRWSGDHGRSATDHQHPYDRDHNGVFDIRDYCPDWHQPETCGGHGDPRVVGHDLNGNGIIDPEDLIFLFSDGRDSDHNGYPDDIAGWDTFEDDNDPYDEPHYGHGTGEAHDSTAEAGNGVGEPGTCPNCRIMPLRVGDSFVADANDFAEAVLFAVDNHASLIQSALGTLNNSRFAQEAIDYAYRRGVALIASAADESAGHHNMPSALEHAVVVNSIGEPQAPPPTLQSYLQFRGCTNYGAYIAVSVPSNSCSSEATGRSAGMAGLAYSAARNAVDRGRLADYGRLDGKGGVPRGQALSAEEVHQLITRSADDINFVTPVDHEARPDLANSQRYPATEGWDPFFGYGRINADRIVSAVTAGKIPPEAYIASPKWYGVVDPQAGPITVDGLVAARRADAYDYKVEWAVWSWRDTNAAPTFSTDGVTLTRPGRQSGAYDGRLATIDPAVVSAALEQANATFGGGGTTGPAVDPLTGRGDHENRQIADKFGVILRLTVTAHGGRTDGLTGVHDKEVYLHHDPALLPGFPVDLHGDGAAAPRFADLDDDGKDELVVGTSNGLVHAFRADGSELPGWPVHTTVDDVYRGDPAYSSGEITTPVYSAVLRSPAVGDLDRDGELEVVVPDFMGRVSVFDRHGKLLRTMRGNPAYSTPQRADREHGYYAQHRELAARTIAPGVDPDVVPDVVNRRDQLNRTMWWFLAPPTLADIDPGHPGLEILEGGADRHLYAWHSDDGSPVTGWPVMLRDPAKLSAVDPVTHEISQPAGVKPYNGAKIVTGAAVADLDGNGTPEVLATVNEQYAEDPNTDDPAITALSAAATAGNNRVYALYADGTAHGTAAKPGWPTDAIVTGWPTAIASAELELLPVVGDGPNGSPVVADADGDGSPDVGIIGTAGPGYVLDSHGDSIYGKDQSGHDRTLLMEPGGALSNSPDRPSIPALGGAIFADVLGTGSPSFAAPAAGLGKLLDVVLPEDQIISDNHLAVWDTRGSRQQLPAFPREVNDLQFLSTPAAADIDGDGMQEVLEGSAYNDLHAFNVLGEEPGLHTLDPSGWPKFTGGWTVVAPAVGDVDGDGHRDVASTTREGNLFVWKGNGASSCAAASWPQWGHDGWDTNSALTDAVRPSPVRSLSAAVTAATVTLSWPASGDDGTCGAAAAYDVRWSTQPITSETFGSATSLGVVRPETGGPVTLTAPRPPDGAYIAVRAYDADPETATAVAPANPSAITSSFRLDDHSGPLSAASASEAGGTPLDGLPLPVLGLLAATGVVVVRRRR